MAPKGNLADPWRLAGLAAGVVAFGLLAGLDTPLQHYASFGSRPALAAAVAALMAIWWITSALPIYWTACVPLVVFPFTRVFSDDFGENALRAALPYASPYIFLFLGGMCIAAAMQQWNLHRRIALGIMAGIGTDPRRLLLGFLVATSFISLWISNTATATMMFPIGMAVIAQFESRHGGRRLEHYGAAIMLAVAYASNVGGIGTKIGTAPNAVFAGFMAQWGIQISFLQYLAVGLPFVVLFIPVVWLALWRIARADRVGAEAGAGAVRDEIRSLGPIAGGERVVLAVFLATAALWIGATPLTDLLRTRVGFPLTSASVEGGISMLAAVALLLWPVRGRRALEPRSLRSVPFETLLLLGGSFGMAAGIEASGLGQWLGAQVAFLRNAPPLAQIALASLATVALSAFASNVATVVVMLNVLHDSVSPPLVPTVLFASTIAASCDFALPAGTPPNAIVFGSGYVTIPRMARTGALLDLSAALLAAGWCWLVVESVLQGARAVRP